MEKYNAFLQDVEQLKSFVKEIESATNRKDIENVDIKAKKLANMMSVRCAYAYKDIHFLAQQRVGQVLVEDTRANMEK